MLPSSKMWLPYRQTLYNTTALNWNDYLLVQLAVLRIRIWMDLKFLAWSENNLRPDPDPKLCFRTLNTAKMYKYGTRWGQVPEKVQDVVAAIVSDDSLALHAAAQLHLLLLLVHHLNQKHPYSRLFHLLFIIFMHWPKANIVDPVFGSGSGSDFEGSFGFRSGSGSCMNFFYQWISLRNDFFRIRIRNPAKFRIRPDPQNCSKLTSNFWFRLFYTWYLFYSND